MRLLPLVVFRSRFLLCGCFFVLYLRNFNMRQPWEVPLPNSLSVLALSGGRRRQTQISLSRRSLRFDGDSTGKILFTWEQMTEAHSTFYSRQKVIDVAFSYVLEGALFPTLRACAKKTGFERQTALVCFLKRENNWTSRRSWLDKM